MLNNKTLQFYLDSWFFLFILTTTILGCLMPCERKSVRLDDVITFEKEWTSNWTSEFFLEASPRSLEVEYIHIHTWILY